MSHSSEKDVLAAFHQLKQTFYTGKTRPISFRKAQLRNLQKFLKDHEDSICEALHKDLGKPRFESITSEIGFLRVEIRHALSNLNRWVKPNPVSTPIAHFLAYSSYRFEPKGLALIIGPWNFPVQLIIAPLIGAIAAGNTAILKPSEFATNVSNLLLRELSKYLDSGAFKVICGDHETSQSLLELPFDHIFFTGSTKIGSLVMQQAAKNLVPLTLELGGKSPCIIGEKIDLKLAAKRISWGKFMNCGQVCLAPDFVILPKKNREQFVSHIQAEISKSYSKAPKKSKDYGRIISEKHALRLKDLLDGQNVILGGDLDIKEKYLSPTLVLNPSFDSPLMQEEIFGPILPILEYEKFEEVPILLEKMPKPLAIYLFSEDKIQIEKLKEGTLSGAFCVNDTVSHAAVSNLPFGGIGASGMGTYHGEDSFQAFSYKRAYFEKSTLIDLPLRYPPFTALYERLANLFLR